MTKMGLDDYLVAGGDLISLRSTAVPHLDECDLWFPPIPLENAAEPPPFPTHVLPPWLRAYAEGLATETQTPVDMAAMMALAVLSAALAKKAQVNVRPGWTEPLNTYTVVGLDSGNRKTRVVDDVVAPLAEHEATLLANAAADIAEARSRRRIAEATLDRAEKDAAQATGMERQTKELEARALARELEKLVVPAEPRLLADDATPEKLQSLLAEHGRIAIMSDEGGIFDIMAGRYSANSAPNIDVYLKGHSGSMLRIDRVGRPSEFVPHPAITMALAVQTSVIEGLMAKPTFRGKGLLARPAYVLPTSMVGRRNARAPSVRDDVRAEYCRSVDAILGLAWAAERDEHGEPIPHPIAATADARELIEAFSEEIEPRLGRYAALGHVADWGSKLPGLVVRYAGILHVAEQPEGTAEPWATPIGAGTMRRAIDLGRYLLAHALIAFALMGADPVANDARFVLGVLRTRDVDCCTARDLFEWTKGSLRKMPHLIAALEVLVERHYVRVDGSDDKAGPGRKRSPRIEVSPLAFGDCANTANSAMGVASEIRPLHAGDASVPIIDPTELPNERASQNSHYSQNGAAARDVRVF